MNETDHAFRHSKNFIFVISDGTGRTATQLLDAALTQFKEVHPEIIVRPEIRSEDQVLKVVAEAGAVNGFVIHTVVSRSLRDIIHHAGRLHNVETIDVMGPLLAQLSDKFANRPAEEPGLFYKLNKAYFERIEAMEFAFRHDDGQRVQEINKAEIVLVGVSRTFKTPLSMFLAHKGWLVANIPILMGRDLPSIVDAIPPSRIFGLTTNPKSLARIRHSRHNHLGGITEDYVNIEMIRIELMHAQKIFNSHPDWSVIKVTNKPIEEIASEILNNLQKS